MATELTPDQIAILGRLSEDDLRILAEMDLPALVEGRRNAMLKALFRSHRYVRQARSGRARQIERDIKGARQGVTKSDACWDQALNRLAALCGEHVPCANTILRICKDVRVF